MHGYDQPNDYSLFSPLLIANQSNSPQAPQLPTHHPHDTNSDHRALGQFWGPQWNGSIARCALRFVLEISPVGGGEEGSDGIV